MTDPYGFVPAQLRDRLVELRHAIHRDPELSFQEERTADRLEAELRTIASEVRRVAGTGVVACIPGISRSGPAVAIRGDIDALPIAEETGLEYASQTPGVMHACGHDVHATWAVGAAHLLAVSPADRDVIILLQPAEETGQGAPAMIAGGALKGVECIFGAHVDRRFPIGTVVADEGALAASCDTFTVTATGSGGHGARPHEAADPIYWMAQFIVTLQSIVARKLDPGARAVVTMGKIHGGTAANIIPAVTTASGTVRTSDPAVRTRIRAEIESIAAGVASMGSLQLDVAWGTGVPPVINPPDLTAVARLAVESVLGEGSLEPLGLVNMASEDFAAYQEEVPGCFLRIGARHPGGEATPAHSPRFYAEDESIFVGAAVLAECARAATRESPTTEPNQ